MKPGVVANEASRGDEHATGSARSTVLATAVALNRVCARKNPVTSQQKSLSLIRRGFARLELRIYRPARSHATIKRYLPSEPTLSE